ncbi:hypothetical protein N665_0383s0055 [Sinapis alba]|nr:hypothetical protein N665_0383s0055 [Sinapis alba]
MRWTGTDFEFDEEIDPEQERTLSVKKKQNWTNHFPTKSTFKTVRRLIFQTNPPAGFSFLIPADHQRPWTPPSGILVTLTVLAAELGIKMSVRLFGELTTPSITAKTGFFYGKMVPKYNVITGKPSKVNFWNHRYFYVKINEASFEDPTIILNGYFNSNIDRITKWSQGGSQSFLEEVEAIRTLSHQHWPDISEARIQATLKRINQAEIPTVIPVRPRQQPMGKLNLSSLPSYADTIGTSEHGKGSTDVGRPSKRRRDSSSSRVEPSFVTHMRSPLPPPEVPEEHHGDDQGEQNPTAGVPVGSAEMIVAEMPMEEHPIDPLLEEVVQGGQLQEPAQTPRNVEVEYPHVIDFKYRSIDVPFIEDHEALARLFRQIKLKKRGMPELDQLHQDSRYREMTRAGAIFFGNTNLIVGDYEMKLKAQEASLIEALTAEKNEALNEADVERSRNELLSAELETLKAQKDLLDSRCLNLEQEKSELSLNFETTTRRLRESREHEVRKERSRVESVLRQQVMPTYEKMGQFLGEQPEIQSRLGLYSQAKGTREWLEKIQSQGLSMDEVLQKAKIDEAYFLEELQ